VCCVHVCVSVCVCEEETKMLWDGPLATHHLKHDIPSNDHYGSLEHFWSAIYMIRTQYRTNTKQT